MKKRMKQLLCIVLAFAFVLCFVPKQTFADVKIKYEKKIVTWKQNTYVQGRIDNLDMSENGWTEVHYFWKITVPANGYVRIQATYKEHLTDSASFFICKSFDKNKEPSGYIAYYSGSKNYLVLNKGTWYVFISPGTIAKWTFVSKKSQSNICRGKAASLPAGKEKVVFVNYGHEAPLWYKVTLPKKKVLTVYFTFLDEEKISGHMTFDLFDSKGKMIDYRSRNETAYRTAALPKGTYYIRVHSYTIEDPSMHTGRLAKIKWK